jgi:hypothetical protein
LSEWRGVWKRRSGGEGRVNTGRMGQRKAENEI